MVSFINVFGVKGFSLFLALGIGLFSASSSPRVHDFLLGAPETAEAPEVDLTKLSVGEIQQKAVAIANTWSGKKTSVQNMLEEAKKKKNIMRTNCLEPKLVKVDFWIKEGAAAQKEMKNASGDALKEKVTLGYQKIAVIDTKVDEQVLQASRCIGDEKFSSGEGFELKASHPTEINFDPDMPTLNFNTFVDDFSESTIVNPDWSVELMTDPATPYY